MSCIAASVVSGILGLMGAKGYMIGGLGIFGLPSHINPEDGMDRSFYAVLIAI